MRSSSARINTTKPDEIARHIRASLDENTERRILVLFDESDSFLDADAKENFRILEGLRVLMSETERRFKVVFAGLHNVQRFQGIPNQPLAHLGSPLSVGPLEPVAAEALVRQPFEVLGYRFSDVGTVLTILSYTNYHPGLIQLFCHELLKQLHVRVEQASAPRTIAKQDVEAVYRMPEVRKGIRERFDWTLALDVRYQAIAWSIIEDQMRTPGSFSASYGPGEILALARGWWSKGFREMGQNELRGLLDEMCGLGVLVRDSDGRYRLRSPNLVRLMGTEADIENSLLELSLRQPPVTFDADSFHAPLGPSTNRYSPFTHSQARSLNAPQFGVGLVFASEALGIGNVARAFNAFLPSDLPARAGIFEQTPPQVENVGDLSKWLTPQLAAHSDHERLLLCHAMRGLPGVLEQQVESALQFCRRHKKNRKQWVRVFLRFDPRATWHWLRLPKGKQENLEEQSDAVVFLRRWNSFGIRQRLTQCNKIASEEIGDEVLRTTGGWPVLLDTLFQRCGATDDPRPTLKAMNKELEDTSSRLLQEFHKSLGLDFSNEVKRILDFLRQEQEAVPLDLITSEMIGGVPPLSDDDCHRAVCYLERMGCIDRNSDSASVEPVLARTLAGR